MEEINLRQCIEVVIKRKWIVLIALFICLFASFIVNYFISKPIFEAKVSLMVNPIVINSGINPNTSIIYSVDSKTINNTHMLENKMLGAILSKVSYPRFDVATMVNYMSSKGYMTTVLQDCKIDANSYDFNKNVRIAANGNGIIISVKDGNAETALKLAKAIGDYLPRYLVKKANEELKTTSDMLSDGIAREHNNVSDWYEKLSDFVSNSGGENMLDKLSPDKRSDYQEILNNYDLAQQALESYQLVNKELDGIKALKFDQLLNKQVSAEDSLPLKPISPSKHKNLVISVILGAILGLFLAFFIEYWSNSKMLTKERY